MKLESLRDLYVEQLQDLYNAEQQLIKALPKMAKAASSEELKAYHTRDPSDRLSTVLRVRERHSNVLQRRRAKS